MPFQRARTKMCEENGFLSIGRYQVSLDRTKRYTWNACDQLHISTSSTCYQRPSRRIRIFKKRKSRTKKFYFSAEKTSNLSYGFRQQRYCDDTKLQQSIRGVPIRYQLRLETTKWFFLPRVWWKSSPSSSSSSCMFKYWLYLSTMSCDSLPFWLRWGTWWVLQRKCRNCFKWTRDVGLNNNLIFSALSLIQKELHINIINHVRMSEHCIFRGYLGFNFSMKS